MRRGFTLLELLVGLTVLGLLAGMAAPAALRWRDQYTVTTSAVWLASAHNRARMHAVLSGATAELEVRSDSLLVRTVQGSDTTLIWAAPGPGSQGVTLGGAPRVTRYIPRGVGYGFANATYTLSRGTAHRQVVVSRLGRLRITP